MIEGSSSPPALTGGSLTLVENYTSRSIPIHVDDGLLEISGLETGPSDCAGLAGVQVVPEPGLLGGVVTGGISLFVVHLLATTRLRGRSPGRSRVGRQ